MVLLIIIPIKWLFHGNIPNISRQTQFCSQFYSNFIVAKHDDRDFKVPDFETTMETQVEHSHTFLSSKKGLTLATLWWTYKKQLKMAIEIVVFPIKNGDFPLLC